MKYLILYYLLLFCIVLCSHHDEKVDQVPTFAIDEQSLQQDFLKDASSISIPVSTNLESGQWSVESSEPSWCLVSQDLSSSEPNVLITVRSSEEPDVRTAVRWK